MRGILLNATCPPQEWAFTLKLICIMLPAAPARRGTSRPCTPALPSAGPPQLWRRKMKTRPLSVTPLRRWRNRRRCTATCHPRLALPLLSPARACSYLVTKPTQQWSENQGAIITLWGFRDTKRRLSIEQKAVPPLLPVSGLDWITPLSRESVPWYFRAPRAFCCLIAPGKIFQGTALEF